MILRVNAAAGKKTGAIPDAWHSFIDSQKPSNTFEGFVSQPAHARLAGNIAAVLDRTVFGTLPAEVIEATSLHDVGWAESDLAALESSTESLPDSFLSLPATKAIKAWRMSIRAAEERSLLSGILTSRHFCLLAPKDVDGAHDAFRNEENKRCKALESASSYAFDDLTRFTSALGFCDLLSLYLCCGHTGAITLPLTHPADPQANQARRAILNVTQNELSFDQPVVRPDSRVAVDGWEGTGAGVFSSRRLAWIFV
jgi:hypothetical protein